MKWLKSLPIPQGHSLGGALATLTGFYAAARSRFAHLDTIYVWTFAAPRVGTGRFFLISIQTWCKAQYSWPSTQLPFSRLGNISRRQDEYDMPGSLPLVILFPWFRFVTLNVMTFNSTNMLACGMCSTHGCKSKVLTSDFLPLHPQYSITSGWATDQVALEETPWRDLSPSLYLDGWDPTCIHEQHTGQSHNSWGNHK